MDNDHRSTDVGHEILRRLARIEFTLLQIVRTRGLRLTRAEMCERLGVTSHTITYRVRRGEMPRPGADGKWLLSEVIEWERRGD
ncbi:helix-turn-helix transcriptional regulator [Variovorax sp. tm]|uniref:helix-turn-helix transcriptional regulator n=1 Tax=Variovorax atrisoli TaxID=3394203 RepID=UPI003A7F91E2